jgi:formylmethanofuran dehydrogenase subunit E
MSRYPEDLEKTIAFHGHFCPGLLIGFRAAKIGLTRLGARRSEDEELIAIVENNSCAADAVQVLTGATFGKGNLFFRDHGKQVFTFALRPSGKAGTGERGRAGTGERGRAVRVSLKAGAFPEGTSREERSQRLLDASNDELFTIEEKTIDLPAAAEIRKSVLCENCGEPVMDTRTRRVKGRMLCIPCVEKA